MMKLKPIAFFWYFAMHTHAPNLITALLDMLWAYFSTMNFSIMNDYELL